jgi:hypothetical protein
MKAVLAEMKRLADRVESLEKQNKELEKSLATERLSEKEPEIATRLKAVEFQTLSMQKQARQIEALEGISVGASLTAVGQRASRDGPAGGASRQSRANYRGDVSVTLPGGEMGDIEGKIFTHFRFGQGNGVGLRPTYTSTPNTTAFETNAGPGRFLRHPRPGLVPAQGAAAARRRQGQLARAPAPDRRQDRLLRLLRPERRGRRRVGEVPQQRLRAQPAAGFGRRHPRRRLRLRARRHPPVRERAQTRSRPGACRSAPSAPAPAPTSPARRASPTSSARPTPPGASTTCRATTAPTCGPTAAASATTASNGAMPASACRSTRRSPITSRCSAATATRVPARCASTAPSPPALRSPATPGDAAPIRSARPSASCAPARPTAAIRRRSTSTPTASLDPRASGTERIGEIYYRFRVNSLLELTPDFQFIQRPGGNDSATIKVVGLRAKLGF